MTPLAAAREIVARYNQAILTKDAGLLASLYAEDAVHELPFSHRPPLAGRARSGSLSPGLMLIVLFPPATALCAVRAAAS